jgi:hypothetical protein
MHTTFITPKISNMCKYMRYVPLSSPLHQDGRTLFNGHPPSIGIKFDVSLLQELKSYDDSVSIFWLILVFEFQNFNYGFIVLKDISVYKTCNYYSN